MTKFCMILHNYMIKDEKFLVCMFANTKKYDMIGLRPLNFKSSRLLAFFLSGLERRSVYHFARAGQDMLFSTPTLFFLALSGLFVFYGLNCHQFFITIVKSRSMMPALHRGDVLLSTNSGVQISLKDIVLAQVCIISTLLGSCRLKLG